MARKTTKKDKLDELTDKALESPNQILTFAKSDTMQVIWGILCIMFAIYTILAFSSFFITGGADQSIIEHLTDKDTANLNHEISNHAGVLGARMAFFWINQCFGLAAFLIPVFLILVGLKLVKAYRIKLWKWFLSLTVIMYWLSVALAYFATPLFEDSFVLPGGAHGIYIKQWFLAQSGDPGLIITLITIALIYLIYISNETINVIRKALNPQRYIKRPKMVVAIAQGESESKEDTPELDEQSTGEIPQDVAEDDDENHLSEEEDAPADEEETFQEEPAQSITLSPVPNTVQPNQEPLQPRKPLLPTDPEFVVATAPKEESVKEIKPYNPRLDLENYKFPTISLLKDYGNQKVSVDMDEQNANKDKIIRVLSSFGVEISSIQATVGPTITLYEITPAEGVRISKIRNLEDDIALSLAALGIRIIAPIPGKGTIGIEVPNKNAQIVPMRDIINSKKFQESKFELPVAFGKTITNEVFMVDLAKAPHMLVAGATGMGKSVGLNAIVTSLLYKKHPAELKFVIVDPKKVEFGIYAPIEKHYLAKLPDMEEAIITDVTKVVQTLKSLCVEMDNRYDLLKKAGVRNIKEYNAKFINRKLNPENGHRYLPYIVVIIDEYGDLMMTAGKEVEHPICRLAQLARAIGIHCIIATQRPTASIVTGSIKANFPARVAFRVAAMIDSRTILDRSGAQQLVGRGDMLYLQGSEPIRVQCAFVDTPEVEEVNNYIYHQQGYTEAYMLPEVIEESEESNAAGDVDMNHLDPLFRDAATLVITYQQGSTSLIQRKFSIGYNRAGRLMDQLERAGIVGTANGSKAREVLCATEMDLEAVYQRLGIG